MGIIAERWFTDQRVHLTVHRATGLRRLTGLIGRAQLAPGTALLFPRCRSVHGCFMKRSIDVAFLGSDRRVLSVAELAPWRVASDRRAEQVLELRTGEAARLGLGPGARLTRSLSQEENDRCQ